MNTFEWTSPRTLAQVLDLRSVTTAASMSSPSGHPPSATTILKAGGIDVLGLMKDDLLTPARIVNLRAVTGLGESGERPDGTFAIGANVTLAQIAADPTIRARYGALANAAEHSASLQLRQIATIGGNLLQRPRCWYFRSLRHHCARKGGSTCFAFSGENENHAIFEQHGCAIVHPSTLATALVALGARVELIHAGVPRHAMPLESFLILPDKNIQRENVLADGEILTAVLLPALQSRLRSVHLRIGEVASFDWPIADVAVAVDIDDGGKCRSASVVLGAAAPVPYRARRAESALVGVRISEAQARRAARAAVADATPLSKNAYKIPIFEALVRRAIIEAARGP